MKRRDRAVGSLSNIAEDRRLLYQCDTFLGCDRNGGSGL
jgi:hypothetical protein